MRSLEVALRRVSVVAVAFSLLVLAALVANAIHARSSDPNPPTRIEKLVTRLNVDRRDTALMEQIRREDEWLRREYARGQRFAATGFVLLIGGVVLFVLSYKGAQRLRPSAPLPDPAAPKNAALGLLNAQQGVLTLGLSLAGLLAVVATLSRHDAISAYVENEHMPVGAAHPPEEKGPALAVLAPPAGAQNAPPSLAAPSAPPPLEGSLPAASEGTELVPMPVSPPPPVVAADPPKKVETSKPEPAAHWSMFRGPAASGIARGNAATEWNAPSGKGVLWKADVPLPGFGSPVVWDKKVFLSGATATARQVFAFDADSGKALWSTTVPMLPKSAPMKESNGSGFAPATAAADAGHVVAVFVNGDVACLDHAGKLLWSLALGALENPYGQASSPVLWKGKLILQVDQNAEGKSALYALDVKTGKQVWAVGRPVQASWSTPLPIEVDGKPIIVTCANSLAIAHDAASGKEIWRADGLYGEVAPSPTVGNGIVYAAQMGAGLFALGAGDGKLLWTTSEVNLPDIGSPVYADGRVFFCGPDGTLSAVSAQDGKLLWEHKFEKSSRSSPVLIGSRLYLTTNEGVTHVCEPGDAYREIARNVLGEPVGATPAAAGGRLYLRGDKSLFCLGEK
ncbi:MAG TPA: PQQ-binding-like beta-propeller repeat protein [Fimbriimonas sp.]